MYAFHPWYLPFHFEDTFLDTAEVARTKLHLVDHELVSLDEQGLLLAFIWIIIRTGECIMIHRQRWTWSIGSKRHCATSQQMLLACYHKFALNYTVKKSVILQVIICFSLQSFTVLSSYSEMPVILQIFCCNLKVHN